MRSCGQFTKLSSLLNPQVPPSMSERPSDTLILTILSANVNKQRSAMESILELTTANILLIQEPPWGSLVPLVSDSDPDGTVRKGTSRHLACECLPPTTSTLAFHA